MSHGPRYTAAIALALATLGVTPFVLAPLPSLSAAPFARPAAESDELPLAVYLPVALHGSWEIPVVPTAAPSVSPSPNVTRTALATESPTPMRSPTPAGTPGASPTAGVATATATAPTATTTDTGAPPATPTTEVPGTETPTPTSSTSPSSTITPAPEQTGTATSRPSSTATSELPSTATNEPSSTATSTATATGTPTGTATGTPTGTPTNVPEPTATTPAACPDPYEPNESFEQAWVIPAGLAVQPYICHSYDWDWFKFQVVAGQQIGAHLVGIPEPWNYELYLYDPNGDVVDWSRHIASSPEHIVLTASLSGWYRLLVFGSEGNADPDHAYSLSVMLSMPTPTVEPASELGAYLEANPRVRDAIALEVREPGVWLAYDSWDASWKTRLREMYEYLAEGRSLPLPDPIPIETHEDYAIGTGKVVYGTQFVARDVYFAHVAHVLLVEVRHLVPWRLSDYSNLELTHLLSSDNLFDAELIYPLEDTLERDLAAEPVFRYTVCYSGCGGTEFGRASESVLSDPRLPYWFMFREPEQGRHLIGNTQTETAIKLTEWFHDFLEHGYADVSWADPYYLQHPYLSDRLRRQSVSFLDHDAYIATWGCWTASALFAELLRSVNVPIKLAETLLQNPDEVTWGRHAGLMYDWQGPEARYLIHTDDIYCCGGHIKDPSPGPGVSRGEALWNHVWLDPGTFGEMFTYDPDPQLLAKATHDQDLRYEAFASWRTASHNNSQPAVYLLCNASRGDALATIMRDGLSQQEAEAAYGAAEAAVRSYGNGDLAAGCDRVAERHTVWCEQTGKCAGG